MPAPEPDARGLESSDPEVPARSRDDIAEQQRRRSSDDTRVLRLPARSEILVSLNNRISTSDASAGTTFWAAVTEASTVDGHVAVPTGSRIRGVITEAERATRVGGRAALALAFQELVTPDGVAHPLSADPMRLEGKSTASGDLQRVLGGAVGGAVIGGILGGRNGAARGAGAGAAAGGVLAVATRGKDIILEAGTQMIVTLDKSLTISSLQGAQALP